MNRVLTRLGLEHHLLTLSGSLGQVREPGSALTFVADRPTGRHIVGLAQPIRKGEITGDRPVMLAAECGSTVRQPLLFPDAEAADAFRAEAIENGVDGTLIATYEGEVGFRRWAAAAVAGLLTGPPPEGPVSHHSELEALLHGVLSREQIRIRRRSRAKAPTVG